MSEFYINPNKNLQIEANGKYYIRNCIKTHFITVGESYIDIVKRYAYENYKDGDILAISEKIIALCQKRVIYRKDLKVGFFAKTLSKFVMKTKAGFSVGNPLKMQVAINICGLWRVLFAAFCSMVTKPFGKRGVFYKVVGHDINGLDGFYGGAYKEYEEMGILNPENPNLVCNEIADKFNMKVMIIDANDLGVNILGKSDNISFSKEELCLMVKDNPAGQDNQQTPLIIIRPLDELAEIME